MRKEMFMVIYCHVCRQIGLKHIIVFINKADLVDSVSGRDL